MVRPDTQRSRSARVPPTGNCRLNSREGEITAKQRSASIALALRRRSAVRRPASTADTVSNGMHLFDGASARHSSQFQYRFPSCILTTLVCGRPRFPCLSSVLDFSRSAEKAASVVRRFEWEEEEGSKRPETVERTPRILESRLN